MAAKSLDREEEPMKINRKIIQIDEELCDGCGQCVPACAEGAIEVKDGKAHLVAEKYCDGLGACLGDCPTGALTIVEREADDFDEAAVEDYLKEKGVAQKPEAPAVSSGCPSTHLQTFISESGDRDERERKPEGKVASSLGHWPVQIHLIPPTAPFLKGADLVIAADCTPVAYPGFHRDFLRDKVVMIGCPKFDDVPAYVDKFAEIFRTADIQSITTVVMEVPCCSALPMIVKKAMEVAQKEIPMEEVVIGTRGEVLKRHRLAA
jgi:ferredoxin